jgi:cytoskeletal protein CcmA (bactofilin family)
MENLKVVGSIKNNGELKVKGKVKGKVRRLHVVNSGGQLKTTKFMEDGTEVTFEEK